MNTKKNLVQKKKILNDKLDFAIITLTIILLFCVSNGISIFGISQPKILGLFFTFSLILMLIRKEVTLKKIKEKKFGNYFNLGLIIFSIMTLISVVANGKLQITNLFEIIRPVIYAISIVVFMVIFEKENNIKIFNKLFLFLIGVLFIINLVQFYNIGNINYFYIKIIAPTQYVTLIDNYPWPRIVGLISNPNAYGYLLTLFNIYVLYLLFKEKNKKKKTFMVISVLLIKISIFLTGSRTAYVSMIVSEFFFAFFRHFLVKNISLQTKIKNSLISCIILLLIEISLLFVLPYKFNWRIKEIFLKKEVQTFEMRKETSNIILNEHLNIESKPTVDSEDKESYYSEKEKEKIKTVINEKENITKKLIIGEGPIKTNIIIECEWIKIFVFYGIVGVISFLLIFILPMFNIKLLCKDFIIYYLTIILSYFTYMITSGAYFSYTLFISILLFISLGYHNEKLNKKSIKNGGKK